MFLEEIKEKYGKYVRKELITEYGQVCGLSFDGEREYYWILVSCIEEETYGVSTHFIDKTLYFGTDKKAVFDILDKHFLHK